MKKLLSFFQKDIKIRNRLILSNLILIVVPITIVTLLFGGRFLTMIRDNVLDEQKLSSLQVSSRSDSTPAKAVLLAGVESDRLDRHADHQCLRRSVQRLQSLPLPHGDG